MVQLLQDDMYRSRLQQLGFRVWGLGFRVWGLGFGLGFGVEPWQKKKSAGLCPGRDRVHV